MLTLRRGEVLRVDLEKSLESGICLKVRAIAVSGTEALAHGMPLYIMKPQTGAGRREETSSRYTTTSGAIHAGFEQEAG
jgi:hypothetical protein